MLKGILLAVVENSLLTAYFSTKGLCWAAALPCAFELQEDIKLRDPDRAIKAGFVRKK